MLYPKEEIYLPVFFYLDPTIENEAELINCKEILIRYQFFKASNQEVAKIVEKELEKHEREQQILAKKQEAMRKQGDVSSVEKSEKLRKRYSAMPG